MKDSSQNTEILHDFTEGDTAKYLKQKLGVEVKKLVSDPIPLIDGVSFHHEKMKFSEGRAFYHSGEDVYLMFYYLKNFRVKKYGFPKFHVVKCRTMKQYSNFSFANKMPVTIYSNDENKTYKDRFLSLCWNCKSAGFKGWFTGFSSKEWYDAVLEYVESQENPIFKTNGYHVMWEQASTAFREKSGWVCQNPQCGIELKSDDNHRFLHVHHRDGNTKNNHTSNFQALCVLCHAFEHEEKLRRREGFSDLILFLDQFEHELRRLKNPYLERVKEVLKAY